MTYWYGVHIRLGLTKLLHTKRHWTNYIWF
jgi:hypothetical protein